MTKRRVLSRIVVVVVLAGVAMAAGGVIAAQPFAAKEPLQVLRHVVLFKFKADATAADIRKVETAFHALPGKIDVVYGYEWGTDVGIEGLSKGFTHCFFLTFKSEADRAVYLPHPEHKAFGQLLGPYLDEVIVVDYWTKP